MDEQLLLKSERAPLSIYAIAKVFNIAPWRQPRDLLAYPFVLVICHLTVLALFVTIAILEAHQFGNYFRAAGALGCNYFSPAPCLSDCANVYLASGSKLDYEGCFTFSTNATVVAIKDALLNYETINSSVANLQHPFGQSQLQGCSIQVPYFEVTYESANRHGPNTVRYQLDEPAIHSFLESLNTRGVLSSIDSMLLVLPLVHKRSSGGLTAEYTWQYYVHYHVLGQAKVRIYQTQEVVDVCQAKNDLQSLSLSNDIETSYLYTLITSLKIASLILGIGFFIVAVFEFLEAYELYAYARKMLARKRSGHTAQSSVDLGDIRLQRIGSDVTKPGASYVSHLAPAVLYGREDVDREVSPQLLRSDSEHFSGLHESGGQSILRNRRRANSRNRNEDDGLNPIDPPNETPKVSSIFQEHRLGHADAIAHGDTIPSQNPMGYEAFRDFKHESELKDWEDLPLLIKLRLFDGWRMMTGVGTLCGSISIVVSLTSSKSGNLYLEGNMILMGVAISALFVSLLGYMRYSSQFTTASLIIGGSLFKVQRILISATPIIVAFILLGLVAFGDSSDYFHSLTTTVITLFSVMNCDSVWDTLQTSAPFNSDIPGQSSYPEASVLKSFYIGLFVVVFTYILLRLILAVIEGLFWYVRIYFKSRKKRNQYKRAVYESMLSRRSSQNLGKRDAVRLILKPPSEQLYVELLNLDTSYFRGAAKDSVVSESQSNVERSI